jgi:hypothetical protein
MKALIALSALVLVAGCASKNTKTDAPASGAAAPAASAPKAGKADEKSAPKAAKAAAAKGEVSDKASCKSGGDMRLIEVVSKEGGGCAVEYTKQNEKQQIATAEHETQHCANVMQKVRGKLEAAGYQCE